MDTNSISLLAAHNNKKDNEEKRKKEMNTMSRGRVHQGNCER